MNDTQGLNKFRSEYIHAGFDLDDCDPDPFIQFRKWFEAAVSAGLREPNAMVLATATSEGRPSARMVLLKEFSKSGFTFFSNYESRKGIELAGNEQAALLFYWEALHRQIRIEGTVCKIPHEASEAYFDSRPLQSRLAAIASPQSHVIESRANLEERVRLLQQRYEGAEVPLPEYWGGYQVCPESMEFWQGRENRLHDRILYTADDSGWRRDRLAP